MDGVYKQNLMARSRFCCVYLTRAIAVDQLREEIMNVCRPLVGLIELEIVLTNQPGLINR